MLPRKSYTAPFWNMLVITAIVAAAYIYILYIISQRRLTTSPGIYFSMTVIYFFVFLAETIVYWKFRKKPMRKLYAWMHITCLYTIFFLTPIIYTVVVQMAESRYPAGEYAGFRIAMANIRMYLHWSLLGLSQVFFIAFLADSIKRSRLEKQTEPVLFESI